MSTWRFDMSLSSDYKFSDLRRVKVRSWLSTFASLAHRAKYGPPSFDSIWIGSLAQPNTTVADVHLDGDTNDLADQPHVDLSYPSHHPPRPHPQAFQGPTNTDIVPPPLESRSNLSIAIEAKFLLPVLKADTADTGFPGDIRPILAVPESEIPPQSVFQQAHESIATTIRNVCRGLPQQQPHQAVTLHNIAAAGRQEREFWDTHWIVKKANSALPGDRETSRGGGYIWVPVEVCSPKLRWDAASGLDAVLSSISTVMRAMQTSHRVTTNHTCDVHVHIGRADGKDLALDTVKKLGTILWLAEDALRSIRDPQGLNYTNVFTWGAELTRFSRLAKLAGTCGLDHERARKLCDLEDGLFLDALRREVPAVDRIWKASSHLQLGRLLSGSTLQYRRLGFNFSSLGQEDERARNGPKTIEFRVLEGTIDGRVISTWVAICWSLVDVAGGGMGGDDRFIRAVRACLGHCDTGNHEQDSLDASVEMVSCGRAGVSNAPLLLRLKYLAVDGLDLEEDTFDAFIQAVLVARTK